MISITVQDMVNQAVVVEKCAAGMACDGKHNASRKSQNILTDAQVLHINTYNF
jgi:hypothetical protein